MHQVAEIRWVEASYTAIHHVLTDPGLCRAYAAAPEIVPHSVVVGPCTQPRAQLVLCGKLDVFTMQVSLISTSAISMPVVRKNVR